MYLLPQGRNIYYSSVKNYPDLPILISPDLNRVIHAFCLSIFLSLFKTPLLLFHIFREHFRLKRIISEYSIDIVISDNRFGLWNRKIKTVYITHMPLIPFPKPLQFLEFIGISLHRVIIRKYSFCFIPDLPGEINVTGRLSHGIRLPDNVRYIGILSRFQIQFNHLQEIRFHSAQYCNSFRTGTSEINFQTEVLNSSR